MSAAGEQCAPGRLLLDALDDYPEELPADTDARIVAHRDRLERDWRAHVDECEGCARAWGGLLAAIAQTLGAR